MESKVDDDMNYPPSAKALDGGYNQTYIIMNKEPGNEGHEVFFRCGNWCYLGQIQFGGLKLATASLPVVIPALQKQQGSLRYFCGSSNIPHSSKFYNPVEFMYDATEFFAREMMSDVVEKELRKMSGVFSWIDDDSSSTYFELCLSDIPPCMQDVSLIASKTYSRGLIIISIYHEKVIYFVLQGGEGDQPLLDVRFPDVSLHGQGLLLSSYGENDLFWKRLTLWQILSTATSSPNVMDSSDFPSIRTLDLSSSRYEQAYCIMKSSWDGSVGKGAYSSDDENQNLSGPASMYHDVLFRFGSWCYSGRVQLVPTLALADVPYVIPALRMQQSRLDYLCDVSQLPTTSPFAPALSYLHRIEPVIERHIADSEITLQDLMERLGRLGLGDSVTNWLQGDPSNSFFEFKIFPDEEYQKAFQFVELLASKCYHASGIVTIVIVFQSTAYVTILDGSQENPLLDSRFPDVSGKGRGYQISSYDNGVDLWPALRKVSVWQTVSALEQEFRDRAVQYAASKKDGSHEGSSSPSTPDSPTGSSTALSSYSPSSTAVIVRNNGGDEKSNNNDNDSNDISGEDSHGSTSRKSPSSSMKTKTFSDSKESKEEYINRDSKLSSTFSDTIVEDTKEGSEEKKDGEVHATVVSSYRPHHLPKLESLSRRMDDIRKEMGTGGLSAPWDAKGKPLFSPSPKK